MHTILNVFYEAFQFLLILLTPIHQLATFIANFLYCDYFTTYTLLWFASGFVGATIYRAVSGGMIQTVREKEDQVRSFGFTTCAGPFGCIAAITSASPRCTKYFFIWFFSGVLGVAVYRVITGNTAENQKFWIWFAASMWLLGASLVTTSFLPRLFSKKESDVSQDSILTELKEQHDTPEITDTTIAEIRKLM